MPLLVHEEITSRLQAEYETDPAMTVWWATSVECVSAIMRRERRGELTRRAAARALTRLDALIARWHEVEPAESVRRTARRLLRVHDLRASDSLQLAAALAASEGHPETIDVLSLDDRLAGAAQREGFAVLDLAGR